MTTSAALRQRRHRQRVRARRAEAWRLELPAAWGPFLAAWADRGLRLPPTSAQLQLLQPYLELPRGPGQLGAVLGRVQRARPRHPRTTFGLVAAVLRAMDQLRQLAQDARDAFDRPLAGGSAKRERGEDAIGAERPPARSSKRASPGQLPVETFAEAMRRHGLAPDLADRLEGRRHGR